jgi:peptide/nickel transport system permease protein
VTTGTDRPPTEAARPAGSIAVAEPTEAPALLEAFPLAPPLGAPATHAAPAIAPRRRRTLVLRAIRKRPLYAFAALLLATMVSLAIVGPLLPLPDASTPVLADRLLAPLTTGDSGTYHLMGTDHLGRDVLARTVDGARVTVGIAITVAVIGAIIGSLLGLASGYFRGPIDAVVMRIADLQLAFPSLLLAIFMLYVLGPGMLQLVILLSALSWIGYARMARAQTLSFRNQPFVEAAIALGASDTRVLLRHILPQLMPVLAMIFVLDFGTVMLAEAGLSFLGLGVQPPSASWGSMVADGRQFVTAGAWWFFLTPGLAILLTVFAANLTSRWAQELLGVSTRR